jgi:hypothetical protein
LPLAEEYTEEPAKNTDHRKKPFSAEKNSIIAPKE